MSHQNQPILEAATVYLLADHQIKLEELKLKLRRQGIKATKSKLVRIAITLLGEHKLETIVNHLNLDNGE